jgi:transposase
MKETFERCAGLDVHRDTVVACILIGYGDSAKKEIKTFSTQTYGIKALACWLEEYKIYDVVIESTGIYWKPIFNIFDERFNVVLANAYHVKNAKGRKTDVKDSEWLCRLFKADAISPSFIPPKNIRRLRELVRYRKTLVRERARVKNRIIKILETANIKLSSVFSDVFGYTSWLIITKIIDGESCPSRLTSYIHGRVKASKEEVQKALEGTLSDDDIIILKHMSFQVKEREQQIISIDEEIKNHSKAFENELRLLQTIPGISEAIALVIISEIGVDMSQFPSHEKLASWAALCPGNNESAGKQKSGRTRRGNNYLKNALVQAAWAASRTKNTYLQSKYKALAARKSGKKAAIAIAHRILVASYYILRDKCEFKELGAQFLDQLQAERKVKYYVKRLEELGYHVQTVEKVKDDVRELVFV